MERTDIWKIIGKVYLVTKQYVTTQSDSFEKFTSLGKLSAFQGLLIYW